MSWIVVVYLAALAVLLFTSLWIEDELSGRIIHTLTLDNFRELWNQPVYRTITRNTLVMAIVVTITDAVLAFPLAYYMVRMASRRMRALLFIGVLMPLWSSYLIKAYTWRLITSQDGPINWALGKVGVGPIDIAFSYTAMWLAFSYLWLPYMVLPVYAALERVPTSFLEASADLGGRAWITFRKVIWPLALPGIAAGSIFTFSLTLGDYVVPDLVGGNNHDFIGNVIFRFQGVAQNVPVRGGVRVRPGRHRQPLPGAHEAARRLRGAVADGAASRQDRDPRRRRSSRCSSCTCRCVVIALNAFSASKIPGWPITNYSTHWFRLAWDDQFARDALVNSFSVGLRAAALALVLGTCVAFALSRFRFFGQNAISLLFVLPIALPGIVTGMALLSAIEYLEHQALAVDGRRRPCDLLHRGRLQQRRRAAAADVDVVRGGVDGPRRRRLADVPPCHAAEPLDRARRRRPPGVRALVRRGRRDALHRRPQQTLPLWMYEQFKLPNTAPEANAVAVFVIALTAVPIYFAQRLMRDTGGIAGR